MVFEIILEFEFEHCKISLLKSVNFKKRNVYYSRNIILLDIGFVVVFKKHSKILENIYDVIIFEIAEVYVAVYYIICYMK